MTIDRRVPGTPRKLFVLPSIDDSLDDETKNAIATRNACATDGQCPCCGAVGEIQPTAVEGVFSYVFQHEDYCIVFTGDAA